MTKLFTLLCFFEFFTSIFGSPDPCSKEECVKPFLEGKIAPENFRYHTFIYALQLLGERKAEVIVETGTSRMGLSWCGSDGCSTNIFAGWVSVYGGEFYSVDINHQNLINSANGLGDFKKYVHLVHSDSIPFLSNFNKPIDFLYLDSFDYDWGNPLPSQEHHLKEIIAAYPWLTPKSIVMIDDVALPGGGKGKLVIDYLQERGWKVIMDGYQVILSQKYP